MIRMVRRGLLVAALAVGGLLLAGPVSAHITVDPSEAEQGGYAKLTFRVPNEKETATSAVEIVFDEKAPIPVARTKPMAGWTAEVTKRPLEKPIKVHGSDVNEAIASVKWTAEAGSEIQNGQFQEFEISVGPLPETDQVVFKALQTYADGEVVRWIDEPTDGGEEPENPAPVLTLVKGSGDGHGTASSTHSGDATDTASKDDVDTAKTWGMIGAGLGLLGVIAAVVAVVLTRRRAGGSS